MRMTRTAWFARFFFGRRRSATREQEKNDHPAPTCPLRRWTVTVEGQGAHAVEAHTKGEARGMVKRKLGLRRLPPKTDIIRGPEVG